MDKVNKCRVNCIHICHKRGCGEICVETCNVNFNEAECRAVCEDICEGKDCPNVCRAVCKKDNETLD